MTPCPSELTLSRYHDGELEPTEKSTVTCPSASLAAPIFKLKRVLDAL